MTAAVIAFPGARRDARWQGYRAEALHWLMARGVARDDAEAVATDSADRLFGVGSARPAVISIGRVWP